MSGRTSAALSPVEGCCGNGGVRGVRGRCWGRNNRLEKQILNTTKTFNIAKYCLLNSAQRIGFFNMGSGRVFPGFSK